MDGLGRDNLLAFLRTLGEDPDLGTTEGRRRVLRLVYLGQAAGVPLGHSYRWWRRGPTSDGVLGHCLWLSSAARGGEDLSGRRMHPRYAASAARVAALLAARPADVEPDAWADALGTAAFLANEAGCDAEAGRTVVRRIGGPAADAHDAARLALAQAGFIAAVAA